MKISNEDEVNSLDFVEKRRAALERFLNFSSLLVFHIILNVFFQHKQYFYLFSSFILQVLILPFILVQFMHHFTFSSIHSYGYSFVHKLFIH